MPSDAPAHPGLLVRDPLGFAEGTALIPPPLVPSLRHFDGESTFDDLVTALGRIAPGHDARVLASDLARSLSEGGFLEDDRFEQMRAARHAEFASAAVRDAAFSGDSYPEEREALGETMQRYMYGDPGRPPSPRAVAVPHVSPEGGWLTYRAGYRLLGDDVADRTFVVLGTSHQGEPERFGLTAKPYVTPFGRARTATDLVRELSDSGGPAVLVEDYCHSIEHSIEFQVIFLQHLFGPDVRVLPILCGSFFPSGERGKPPESNEDCARFFGALGDIAAREGDRLVWILGVDMAHMGLRYGDPEAAIVGEGPMRAVETQDRERLGHVASADAGAFWDLVHHGGDDPLKWCGTSPIYTFMKANPGLTGDLVRYDQWNIDEESVVGFAAMRFDQG